MSRRANVFYFDDAKRGFALGVMIANVAAPPDDRELVLRVHCTTTTLDVPLDRRVVRELVDSIDDAFGRAERDDWGVGPSARNADAWDAARLERLEADNEDLRRQRDRLEDAYDARLRRCLHDTRRTWFLNGAVVALVVSIAIRYLAAMFR